MISREGWSWATSLSALPVLQAESGSPIPWWVWLVVILVMLTVLLIFVVLRQPPGPPLPKPGTRPSPAASASGQTVQAEEKNDDTDEAATSD